MIQETNSLKRTARIAGLLYFILAILGIFSLMYVPPQIGVKGDDVATCRNIVNKEFLFRLDLAVNVITNVMYIFLAMQFYKLFENVNRNLCRLLVAFVLVQVPFSFSLSALDLSSLLVLKGDIMKYLTAEEAQKFAILFRRTSIAGTGLMQVFWGLWLFPMGILAYKSGFIPRIIGVLVLITGVAYTVQSLMYVLFPEIKNAMEPYMFPFFFGELSIILYLFIKGIKSNWSPAA